MKNAVKWIAGVVLCISGLASIASGGTAIFAGLLWITAGLICLPPSLAVLERKLKKKLSTTVKYTAVVIYGLVGIAAMPTKVHPSVVASSIPSRSTDVLTNVPTLKVYDDVPSMIKATYDYHEENGTFKLLSKVPLHIQLAKMAQEGESEDVLSEQVKRDILYVGFRAFAQTSTDEITISSMPLLSDSNGKKPLSY